MLSLQRSALSNMSQSVDAMVLPMEMLAVHVHPLLIKENVEPQRYAYPTHNAKKDSFVPKILAEEKESVPSLLNSVRCSINQYVVVMVKCTEILALQHPVANLSLLIPVV